MQIRVIKTLAAATVMACAGGVAGAVTSTCDTTTANGPNTYDLTYSLTTNGANNCYFIGEGDNQGNDQSNDTFTDMILADGLGLITKIDSAGTLEAGDAGYVATLADMIDKAFAGLDFSGLSMAVLVFKAGNSFGAFAFDTSSTPVSGSWNVSAVRTAGNGNLGLGLSHISLYGAPAVIPLPAGGLLLLGALGGLGALRRRRRAA